MNDAGPEPAPRCVIRGRAITSADLDMVQALMRECAHQGRWQLAQALAQRWHWRTPLGQYKVRAAQAVLQGLEQRGWVVLPPSMNRHPPRPAWRQEPVDSAEPILAGTVQDYRPLRWEVVRSVEQRQQWRHLLAQHHYLGAPSLVGANLKYLVWSRRGELLAVLGWQSAVEHLECRDQLVGWTAAQRAQHLDHVVNQVRFLLLPWVRVPQLASVLLSESVRQLQGDWPRQYGAGVWLVESFVDRVRFSGKSYRAANWVPIGWTRGYAKCQSHFIYHGQPKEVYVYVLEPRLRRRVSGQATEPLMTPAWLLAQRVTTEPQPSARSHRMKEVTATWTPKLPPHWELSEADVVGVRQDLEEFTALLGDTFGRVEPTELCLLYLQGLLSDAERKNVEAIALELDGPEVVRNLQRFITDYQWDESWLRQRHRELVAPELAHEQGVWSIDACEFPKKGTESVGVAPQYCGALGKTANCQSGVFICYSSPLGHALLDDRLYLPERWFTDAYAERRQKCRVPEKLTFHTKPQLALDLLKPLWDSGLFPGNWITCDASFGNNADFLAQLPPKSLYLATIACTHKVWVKAAPGHADWKTDGCPVERLAEEKGFLSWQNHKVAEGEKGPLVAAFARLRVYIQAEHTPESERWLLVRNDANGKIKYALSNAPATTPMTEFVRVSAARWPIERCFEEDKSELGLDHYEHRSWPAWHRHMRLVFLAQLFLLRLRRKYKKSPGADLASSPAVTGMELAPSAGGGSLHVGNRFLSSTTQLSSL